MNNKHINVDLTQCSTLECECGNIFFEKDIIVKIIPGIIIGAAKNTNAPIEILRCKNCGKVLPEYEPLLNNQKN